MTTVDTHTAIKRLIANGFTEQQSEAIVNSHNNNFITKERFSFLEKEIVTKIDLIRVENTLKSEIKEIKTDIKSIILLLVAILGILMKNTFFN